VITEHERAGLTFDPGYLGVRRDDDVVFVQITLRRGRTVGQKRGLYARIAELAALRPGVVPGNILVNLVEVGGEDWSFGDGVAQYAPAGG
jgi:phenylpyruvate tautomerase PptA (4-oxalocrotonate tautomerase family)